MWLSILNEPRRNMKKASKVFGAILAIALTICLFVLQWPDLKKAPTIGKWYRASTSGMTTSEEGKYRASFKKGSENKVMVYFAGVGVSIDEETTKDDTYKTSISRY